MEKKRIGVYVCHCGVNIASTVDVKEVARYASYLPNVVIARDYVYMCSEPGQQLIKRDIRELNLTGVVVAACSPGMHEQTFRACCEEAGMNPYLFEQANIREHCSWVHEDVSKATEKAKSLVRAAVAKISEAEPLERYRVSVCKNALVIGGGIAGIQASLDIANAGFHVYLVEKEPSIGGHMAQLDKTFPTLDCSACILTPKMVEVSRHENITLITYAEVEEVSGYVGGFNVKIRKKARYIDEVKCTGCGECAKICPQQRIVPNAFDCGMSKTAPVFIPFPQAVPLAYTILKREGKPPCELACPAGVNVQGYVALISAGRYKEAVDLIRKTNPLPSVCGYVCPHPCESECNRREVDEAVAIRALKRFVTDRIVGTDEDSPPSKREEHVESKEGEKREERERGEEQEKSEEQEKGEERERREGGEQEKSKESEKSKEREERRNKRVAVIGSGPAGLTAAYFLALKGYSVKIFERLPVVGGMLSAGIPEYRLPRHVLQKDIEYIKKAGVEIECGVNVDKDKFREICDSYDAVFISVGAHKSRRLGVEGEDLRGVLHGVDFLREFNLGKDFSGMKGKRVIVVGGGDVAIDVARTSLRIGADVTVAYRRSREEMPAREEEVEEAEEEGVKFMFLVNPVRIIGDDNGNVKEIEMIRMRLGSPDETGRRRSEPIKGSEFKIDSDFVIIAIGQYPDLSFVEDYGIVEKGLIKTDENGYTGVKNIFAGGDCVSGPATVVEAVGAGRKAAEAIDRFLQRIGGETKEEGAVRSEESRESREDRESKESKEREESKKKEERRITIDEVFVPEERRGRVEIPKIPIEKRRTSFECVELGYDEAQAREEASRCLHCKLCCECLLCESVCEADAINHSMTDEIINLNVGAIVVATGFDLYEPDYVDDRVITAIKFERMCNASGPTGGKIEINGSVPKRILLVSCVGSREFGGERKYCSRICCMYIAKQAHLIKEKIPDAEITVLYTDVRAFGKGFEEFYQRVLSEGIKYVRRELDEEINIRREGDIVIVDAVCEGKKRRFECDLVILATAVVPREDSLDIARKLKISLGSDGFFIEAHPKLRPVDTLTEGIFIAGCCQSPKDIPDSVAQASAAASRACSLLSQDYIEIEPVVAVVDEKKCIGCGSCLSVCEFGAIEMREFVEKMEEVTVRKRKSHVNAAVCKGCGACVAECPVGAINQMQFSTEQINAMIHALKVDV